MRAAAALVMLLCAVTVISGHGAQDSRPTRDELGAMLVAADDYIEELEYELSQGCENEGE